MKDEIKEIISIYNAILENKDVLIKEATDVYDDVDFKDNVVGNSTPSKDTITLALLQDVQTAAKNAGLKVDITTAVSGHRPSVRHDAGNAVDIPIPKKFKLNERSADFIEQFRAIVSHVFDDFEAAKKEFDAYRLEIRSEPQRQKEDIKNILQALRSDSRIRGL